MGHYSYKVKKNGVTNKWELVETCHSRHHVKKNGSDTAIIYSNKLKKFVVAVAKEMEKNDYIVHYN